MKKMIKDPNFTNIKKAMNSEELSKYWDNFSITYSTVIENSMLPFYYNILSLCRIQNSTDKDIILELSIGSGHGFNNMAQLSPAKLFGGDISPIMLNAGKERLSSNKNLRCESFDLDVIDNEDLSRFKDNTFRNVISNMSLHLVNNPLKMLIETKRVLNKESKDSSACFSVWGRPENNMMFTLIPKHLRLNNVLFPEDMRSNFHLSKKDLVFDLCKEAGFENIVIDYVDVMLPFSSYEEYSFFLETPSMVKIFNEEVNKGKFELVKESLKKELDEFFANGNRIKLEALVVYLH
jgi:ubiquinone/menaquinone biosynthesis C-methylase UbiE